MSREMLVVLDGGVLLNLVASGFAGLFTDGPYHYVIPEGLPARPLALWVDPPNNTDVDTTAEGARPALVEVDVGDFVTREQLTVEPLDDCLDLFVNLAAVLRDAQAMTLALALTRHAQLATDDRRLRRVIRELRLDITLLSTPAIVKDWLTVTKGSEAMARAVVQAIVSRAQFAPLEDEPLAAWWGGLLT